MNKIFAAAFATIAVLALCGAIFCDAPWHYATFACCGIAALLFYADEDPKQTGLSGR